MNSTLPKTRIHIQNGGTKGYSVLINSLARLSFKFGIAKKGRVG